MVQDGRETRRKTRVTMTAEEIFQPLCSRPTAITTERIIEKEISVTNQKKKENRERNKKKLRYNKT